MIYEKEGGPAQPVDFYVDGTRKVYVGMSLRDWFAGQALIGLIAKLPVVDQTGKLGVVVDDKISHNDDIAGSVYAIADAMLKARGQ